MITTGPTDDILQPGYLKHHISQGLFITLMSTILYYLLNWTVIGPVIVFLLQLWWAYKAFKGKVFTLRPFRAAKRLWGKLRGKNNV